MDHGVREEQEQRGGKDDYWTRDVAVTTVGDSFVRTTSTELPL